jgi:hypothetical protein
VPPPAPGSLSVIKLSAKSSAQAYWELVEAGQPQPMRSQRAPAGTSITPVLRCA